MAARLAAAAAADIAGLHSGMGECFGKVITALCARLRRHNRAWSEREILTAKRMSMIEIVYCDAESCLIAFLDWRF